MLSAVAWCALLRSVQIPCLALSCWCLVARDFHDPHTHLRTLLQIPNGLKKSGPSHCQARFRDKPAGFGDNPEIHFVLIPTLILHLLTGSRQTNAPQTTRRRRGRTAATCGSRLDGNLFSLLVRTGGCGNFMIFVIYVTIRPRGCVYIKLIPKIAFKIGCGR